MLHDKVEKFSIRYEFHDQVELFLRLNNFINLHNIRMMKLLQYLNLSTDSLNVLFVLDPWLFKHFNSYL